MNSSSITLGAIILSMCMVFESVLPTDAASQDAAEPINIGDKLQIRSDVLDEMRQVLVYKPVSYNQGSGTYPVVYLLDGDAHFHHTTGILQFLAANQRMPEALLVALPNTDRTRDLTPPLQADTTSAFPTSGGADNFLKFISDELMPFVEAKYRTQPYKVLIGHSFGGLFATHALLSRPDVFNAYISISPSLWWDKQRLISEADGFFEKNPEHKGYMYITMGNEGGAMLGGAWKLSAIFEEKAPETFGWAFELMDKETHGSVPHRSTYDGLETLFDGWTLPIARGVQFLSTHLKHLATTEGLDAVVNAVDHHYEELSDRFGYKIDTPEQAINELGYLHLNEKKYTEAIAVFQRNVKEHPGSANVYDSLGDAYKAAGQLDMAEKSYAKAVSTAEAISHPTLETYRSNLENVRKMIAENPE